MKTIISALRIQEARIVQIIGDLRNSRNLLKVCSGFSAALTNIEIDAFDENQIYHVLNDKRRKLVSLIYSCKKAMRRKRFRKRFKPRSYRRSRSRFTRRRSKYGRKRNYGRSYSKKSRRPPYKRGTYTYRIK